MKLTIPDPYGIKASDALRLAIDRGLMPTSWGTKELREVARAVKDLSVFSARTTNAVYVQALKDRVQRYLSAGYKGDRATLRLELKQELAQLGYSPETGFPGDEKLGIPPAEPGSLQDLGSDRRIDLILETQLRLMTGKAQRAKGLTAVALERYPFWELVRINERTKKRNWPKRWVEASGSLTKDQRMIAHKLDPVWEQIGSSEIFDDALDVSHPPFAFGSGMGWKQIDQRAFDALEWLHEAPLPVDVVKPKEPSVAEVMPAIQVSTDGLEPGILKRLKKSLGAALKRAVGITFGWIWGRGK